VGQGAWVLLVGVAIARGTRRGWIRSSRSEVSSGRLPGTKVADPFRPVARLTATKPISIAVVAP
jgi:hypothetical protein